MSAIARKIDEAEIRKFLKELGEQSWIKTSSRSWWPQFVFHHTDVRNAVEILKSGTLLSRSELEKRGRMIVDNASPQIVAGTHPYVKGCVRLYFRPKTPTEYRSEGIRPRGKRELGGAHCPMPVFFLFNAGDVLSRRDCQFSSGNLAAFGTHIFSTAAELKRLDFRRIYHVGQIPPNERKIVHCRNAEVIIPRELDLSSLEYIFCRSPAEKETLIYLLPEAISGRWNKKILIESKSDLFHRNWSFVETADLTNSHLTFQFSPDTNTPGPFDLDLSVEDVITQQVFAVRERAMVNATRRFKFTRSMTHYRVQLKLDDDLAYENDYLEDDDVPF